MSKIGKKVFSVTRNTFAVIGLIAVGGTIVTVKGLQKFKQAQQQAAADFQKPFILQLEFNEDLVADKGDVPSSIAKLFGKQVGLAEIVKSLRAAAEDNNCVGVVARFHATPYGLAEIQELRDALKDLSKKEKFTVAFSETMGEFISSGNKPYYLATAFDEICVQPTGTLGLTGLSATTPFLRGVLDKIGVEPIFVKRHEYKNAPNQFTEKSFDSFHREATVSMLTDLQRQIAEGISESRKIPLENVYRMIAEGPFQAKEALALGLIDRVGYADQVIADVQKVARKRVETAKADAAAISVLHTEKKAQDQASVPSVPTIPSAVKAIPIARYAQKLAENEQKALQSAALKTAPAVAIIGGEGPIFVGRSKRQGLGQSKPDFSSVTVSTNLRKAIDDPNVKAIVFQVNSPGGSAVGSDTIWREVARARELKKPIIVSMGNAAASGGYYVSTHAHKIVAEPATLTGSIGVFGGKMIASGLLEKIGLTVDKIDILGDNGRLSDPTQPWTPAQMEKINQHIDAIYEDFTDRVAEGRNIPKERVLEIAKGRVYTGAQAQKVGLVDELGGLNKAIAIAKKEAGLETAPCRVFKYPKEEPPMVKILKTLSGKQDEDGTGGVLASIADHFSGAQKFALWSEANKVSQDMGFGRLPSPWTNKKGILSSFVDDVDIN